MAKLKVVPSRVARYRLLEILRSRVLSRFQRWWGLFFYPGLAPGLILPRRCRLEFARKNNKNGAARYRSSPKNLFATGAFARERAFREALSKLSRSCHSPVPARFCFLVHSLRDWCYFVLAPHARVRSLLWGLAIASDFSAFGTTQKILLIPTKPTVFHSRVPAKFPVFCRAFSAWSLREKITKMERQDAAPPKKFAQSAESAREKFTFPRRQTKNLSFS